MWHPASLWLDEWVSPKVENSGSQMQILCQHDGKGPPEWRVSMKSCWSLDDWLPWRLFQPWNRNLPFKKPFACCQRQQSFPKAFCSKRRREMKSFFLFLWIQQRSCKKLNTRKRPSQHRNYAGIFLNQESVHLKAKNFSHE